MTSVGGRRVLVVEDEVIVGMLVEDMLGELGHRVVALSTRLEEALRLAAAADIDFAILDVNLNGQLSFPVADALRERGIPFIFATGYGAQVLRPPYGDTPSVQKPFQIRDLERALMTVLA